MLEDEIKKKNPKNYWGPKWKSAWLFTVHCYNEKLSSFIIC